MRQIARACLVPLFSAFLPLGAAQACDPRFAASPQLAPADCTFQNPPNPQAKPHRSSWGIWMRFGAGEPKVVEGVAVGFCPSAHRRALFCNVAMYDPLRMNSHPKQRNSRNTGGK